MNRSLTSLALVLAPICSFAQSNTNNCMGQDRAEDYFAVVQQYLASSATSYWTKADCKLIAPIWTGDDAKGQLFTPLWQGIGAAIEDWVPSVPPGTEVKGTVRIDWDKAANTVTTTLKVINVPVNPPVRRIDGGDPEISDPADPRHYIPPPNATWWFNQFHPTPKDLPVNIANGTAYRFWTIFASYNTGGANFYYDANTLLLKGSDLDLAAAPPPGTFPVNIPVATLTATSLIYPDHNGFLTRTYTTPYDKVTAEGGRYSTVGVGFVPTNLCRSPLNAPARGQLRPYVGKWRPASAGLGWEVFLRSGLLFDLTVEEGRPNLRPGDDDQQHSYIYSGAAFVQGIPGAPGGVPRGWHFSLPAVIQNVGPPQIKVPTFGGFVSDPAVTGPLYCRQ